MKHVTDVASNKVPNPESTKSPPINIPTALFILLMKRYNPFANSGASLIDELSQYWEIVCIEPSNSPKIINNMNTYPGTSIPMPKRIMTIAKTIG